MAAMLKEISKKIFGNVSGYDSDADLIFSVRGTACTRVLYNPS
jgi:hypothetical protein